MANNITRFIQRFRNRFRNQATNMKPEDFMKGVDYLDLPTTGVDAVFHELLGDGAAVLTRRTRALLVLSGSVLFEIVLR